MAIIIVTATKNATTKDRDYLGLILGRVLKTEGSAVSAPDTTSFESRRPFLPTSTGAVESQRVLTFHSPVVKKPVNPEAGRGVGARFGYYGHAPRPSSILLSPGIGLCVTGILRNFPIF
jgi:hypothetical protein